MELAYLSLYRKYRPQTFQEVIGQDHIVRTVMNALNGGRVAHAYLFAGPRGTGKTTFARLLAKGLNCEHGPTGTPCGQCAQCERIARGSSVDVIEIDGASNRGIDEIRDLRERVRYAPAEGRTKVYIIDEVHMLTNEAFNALLKVLEEPPQHIVFIFATTEAHKIPATILSRCQKFDFRRFSLAQTMVLLERVVQAEGVEAERQALVLIARQAEGGMRDALAILDQCLAAEPAKLAVQTVIDVMGTVRRTALAELTASMVQEDLPGALQLVNKLLAEGVEVKQLARDLTLYVRDLLLLNLAPQMPDIVAVDAEERTQLAEQARTAGTASLMRLLQSLEGLESELRWVSNPGLSLELALARCIVTNAGGAPPLAVQAEPAGGDPVLAKRVAALESALSAMQRQLAGLQGSQPAVVNIPPAQPVQSIQPTQPVQPERPAPAAVTADSSLSEAPEQNPPAAAEAPVAGHEAEPDIPAATAEERDMLVRLRQGWPEILGLLREDRHPQSEAFLREGVAGAVRGRTVVIYYAPKHKFHQANMEQPRCKTAAEKAISRFLRQEVNIRTELGVPPDMPATAAGRKESELAAQVQLSLGQAEQAAASDPDAGATGAAEETPPHPAVHKALHYLGGRIVGVRDEEEKAIDEHAENDETSPENAGRYG